MALTTEDIQLMGNIMANIVNDAIDDRVPGIVRKVVYEVVHEIVDPRFDKLEAIVADHGVRLDRLEKVRR